MVAFFYAQLIEIRNGIKSYSLFLNKYQKALSKSNKTPCCEKT